MCYSRHETSLQKTVAKDTKENAMKHLMLILLMMVTACNNPPTTSKEQRNMSNEPFSFRELRNVQEIPIPPIETVTASDGIKLAYRAYVPKHPKAGIIFYHGGGAHSAAGYQYLGAVLSAKYKIATFTPDIRGHGGSEGARGDAPNPQQVLKDISSLVVHIKKHYPHLPIYLGGHSSGAGLVLNYSGFAGKADVEGYVFLAPQLGYRSKTERADNPHPFAQVNVLPFIINGMIGGFLLGHSKAVTFNYPAKLLEADAGFVGYNTVNMANALTPSAPQEQLNQLDKPLGVWIGDSDEVLDADKVVSFVKSASSGIYVKKVSGEKHLSILIQGAHYIGPWILDRAKK
jgi:pimeloyl-ACP methyl ester carboxylesterase